MAGRKVSFREHAVEEFIPSAAWSEDSLSHFLLVDLPDFNMEDLKLKVDYEKQHITVSGQRLMNNNKYKYLEKTFKAPENSEISKTTGKFEGEILYLTIPKKEHIIKDEIRKDKDNYVQKKPSCEEIGSSSQNNEEDEEKKPSGDEIKSSENKGEDEKNNQEKKKGSCVDEFEKEVIEKRGKECSVIEKTMKMVSTNKEILVIALLVFSIGILVSRKLR